MKKGGIGGTRSTHDRHVCTVHTTFRMSSPLRMNRTDCTLSAGSAGTAWTFGTGTDDELCTTASATEGPATYGMLQGDLPHVGRTLHPQLNDHAAKDETGCEARRLLYVY